MDNQPFLLHPGGAEESGISKNDNLSSGARDAAADDDGIVPAPTAPRSSPSYVDLVANLNDTKKLLIRRSHSAPSMFSNKKESVPRNPGRAPEFTFSMVCLPLIYVLVYITIGVAVYMTTGSLKNQQTMKPARFIDAVYFTMVTLCTTGYGDISPTTTFTKLFTCALILAGLWILGILLNGLVPCICDRLEAVMLRAVDENSSNAIVCSYMVDKNKGRILLALGVVFICIAVGTVTVHFLEGLSCVDSFYLSVISVTTVGYGDCKFSTQTGRCFAVVWLLFSTLAVARAFLYLTEPRIDQRNRPNENRVLQQKMTLGDLIAADLHKDGCVRRSEFIIYKLKQMGKIAERDVAPISNRFNVLDTRRFGKITLSDLIMESE